MHRCFPNRSSGTTTHALRKPVILVTHANIHPPAPKQQVYKGHEGRVRSISVSPNGQFIVSGSDDKTARVWEVTSGRCLRVYQMDEPVVSVAWNPSTVN